MALFTKRHRVRSFFIFISVTNCIFMGLQADDRASSAFFLYAEGVFNCIFIAELSLKLYGFGLVFFTDMENCFDTAIVAMSTTELVYELATRLEGQEKMTSGVSVFRILQLFRLIRLVSYLKRLNILVTAFLLALKDIVWVCLLVMLMLYVFAIVATNFYGKDERLIASGFAAYDMFGKT
jgi:voltage-gated sodium channel